MNPIREAISRLPGHWFQGGLADGNGNYCGVGHVYQTLRGEEDMWEILDAAWEIMNEVANEQYGRTFAVVNDNLAESEAEIIAVMEKAAVKWDEQNG